MDAPELDEDRGCKVRSYLRGLNSLRDEKEAFPVCILARLQRQTRVSLGLRRYDFL